MSHLTEDEILRHVMGLLDEDESGGAARHLVECNTCQEIERAIRHDIDRLSGLRMDSSVMSPPLPMAYSSFRIPGWLRAAAILLIGFVSGVSVSRLFIPKRFVVEPMPPIVLHESSGSNGPVVDQGDALGMFAVPDQDP
jgi:anti-sigma factor RsiW